MEGEKSCNNDVNQVIDRSEKFRLTVEPCVVLLALGFTIQVSRFNVNVEGNSNYFLFLFYHSVDCRTQLVPG